MKTIQTRTLNLEGSNYDIGCSIGSYVAANPALAGCFSAGFDGFTAEDAKKASSMFDRWCPGLTEELTGFADTLKIAQEQVIYYAMTYLRPNCSHIALLPQKTTNGHPLLARNYEFNEDAEDFMLIKTSAKGRYTHLGTSVLSFGRDDGFNEHGLAVTMSSCGFPVGAMEYMRRPALTGLQFWAVIRAVLENCRTVENSLDFLKDMPTAYNLNLLLADKNGHAALVETMDGHMAVRQIDDNGKEPYLHATNHPHLPQLIPYEPKAMKNSLIRYDLIREIMEKKEKFSADDLKTLLLAKYPDGLCCHYYKEFFGTTKSMIIDPVDGTIELCWGGRIENGWQHYAISESMSNTSKTIELSSDTASPALFDWESLH